MNDVQGIYILVLDKYKQVYIGQSNNMKKRIMRHWTKRKEFEKLILENKNNSKISIDSFGALDTTRIFYKKVGIWNNIDDLESKCINEFNDNYILNRVGGEIKENNEFLRNLELMSSTKKENFDIVIGGMYYERK